MGVGVFGLYKANQAYTTQQELTGLLTQSQISEADAARVQELWQQSATDLAYAEASLGIVIATGAAVGIGAGLGFVAGLGMYGAGISTGLGIGLTALSAPGLIYGGARLVSGRMSGPEAYEFVGSLAFGLYGGYRGARAGMRLATSARWRLRVAPTARQLYPEYRYWRRQGLSPAEATAQARLMAERYEGIGQHFITQKRFEKFTGWISDRLPRFAADRINAGLTRYMDSPLNLVSGRNMTYGEFYRYHYMLHAGRAFWTKSYPGWARGSQFWNGNLVSPAITGVNNLGYILFSTPAPLSGLIAGGTVGAGVVPEF